MPGEYAVSAGHSNGVIFDGGDWTGTVQSPFQGGLVIVKDEKKP